MSKFRVGDRITLTPEARKKYPDDCPTGVVVEAESRIVTIQPDDGTGEETWNERHWELAAKE